MLERARRLQDVQMCRVRRRLPKHPSLLTLSLALLSIVVASDDLMYETRGFIETLSPLIDDERGLEARDLLELGLGFSAIGHMKAAEFCFVRSKEMFQDVGRHSIDSMDKSCSSAEMLRGMLHTMQSFRNVDHDLRREKYAYALKSQLREAARCLKRRGGICDACFLAAIFKELDVCTRSLTHAEDCDLSACDSTTGLDMQRFELHRGHCLERVGCPRTAVRVVSRIFARQLEMKRDTSKADHLLRNVAQRLIILKRRLGDFEDAKTFFSLAKRVMSSNLPWRSVEQIPLHFDEQLEGRPWHDPESSLAAQRLKSRFREIRSEFCFALKDARLHFESNFDRDIVDRRDSLVFDDDHDGGGERCERPNDVVRRICDASDTAKMTESVSDRVPRGSKRRTWSRFMLMRNGLWDDERCELLPHLCAALKEVSEVSGVVNGIGYVTGEVSIMKLDRGVRLTSHVGPTNRRLTLHFSLSAPNGFYLRVGDAEPARQTPPDGAALLFDDSFEHEVWSIADGEHLEKTERPASSTFACDEPDSRYILLAHVHHPSLFHRNGRKYGADYFSETQAQ